MKKILIIGPRTNKKNPSDTGGAIVLFENLIEQLHKQDIKYKIVDTNKKNYSNIWIAYISIIFQILTKQFSSQIISLHSSKDYIVLAPIMIIIGKIFGKTTSLRKFGGEAERSYIEAKGIKKKLLYFIFTNVDTLFLEMKYLVKFFLNVNPHTYWFPNVRERKIEPTLPREYKKRFVFISHVKKEKGIDEILEASLVLDESYIIDIYGPISDSKYNEKYFEKYNVRYLGPLLSQDVPKILDQYDVLLLPSYKEGYPGIVIEAYAMGVPVIATNLQGLQEIVEPAKTGVLIEPQNVKELIGAIEYFNAENYKTISQNAYSKFDEFKADIQTKLFLERLLR
jgi:glycosyltransferase involved in cell wall biosynthesis